MTDNTRSTLLARLQDGGSDVDWVEFNKFYFGMITTWARGMGCSASVAQDIYQNACINIIANIEGFKRREAGDFRKWMKTIVRRRATDHFRWEGRHNAPKNDNVAAENPFAKPPDEMKDRRASEEAMMDRTWLHQVMDQALAAARKRVSAKKYETFRRYVIYERPVKEVSEETGVAVATIFQHKNSFLNTLREEFLKQLGDVFELGPALKNEEQAKKALKNALAEYLQTKQQYRHTLVVENPPDWDGDRVDTIRAALAETPPPAPGPHLLLIDDRRREWFSLSGEPVTIGTAGSCTIRSESEGVSNLHATVSLEDQLWIVRDENSTNGLLLNRRQIAEQPLHSGDWLQMGKCALLFWEPGEGMNHFDNDAGHWVKPKGKDAWILSRDEV